jgi:ribosome maturation factor RimP
MEKLELAAQIKHFADQHLSGSSHFVLDVKVNARLNPPRITVVVDGDSGITIDDCANLSRALGDAIHQENVLEDYNLEVTTPGIDQPLKLLRQYAKHVGRTLKIELKEKETVRGKLQQVGADAIILEEEAKKEDKKAGKNIRTIAFDQIDKTFVTVSFK